jgi:hypothetical protein
MVFVHVHRGRREVEPTREEAALLREFARQGVAGENLASALASRGVEPERARALAGLVSPVSAAERATRLGLVGFGVLAFTAYGLAKRPLRHWLRQNWPGSEWLVELIVPLVLGLTVLWTLLARQRTAGDAPQGTVRADKIENKPIG